MLTLLPSIRIHLALAPADMRKSVDGLSALVASELGEDALSGHLFFFRNRRGDRLKGVYWDRNGVVVWCKRPEDGYGALQCRTAAGAAGLVDTRRVCCQSDDAQWTDRREGNHHDPFPSIQ